MQAPKTQENLVRLSMLMSGNYDLPGYYELATTNTKGEPVTMKVHKIDRDKFEKDYDQMMANYHE
jgi:hypothetical protein